MNTEMNTEMVSKDTTIPHSSFRIRRDEERKIAFIVKFSQYLESNFHRQNLTVKNVANELGVSSRDLNRKCRLFLNSTSKEFLDGFRINEAIQLVQQGNALGNIAFDIGYSSHVSFCRNFKKRFGCSPSNYYEVFLKNMR